MPRQSKTGTKGLQTPDHPPADAGLPLAPTPSRDDHLPRRYSDFATLCEALDYAAQGARGLNFYSGRGELQHALPYRDLRERAVSAGRRLAALGLETGARVALIAETSPDFMTLFLGCAYAGVLPVPLPLPTSFGGREGYCQQLNRQMASCGARAAIGPAGMQDLLNEAVAGLDLDFAGDFDRFATLRDDADLRLPAADDLAYLQYSSGSTRFPHGIAVTHRSLMANCYGMGKIGTQVEMEDRCVSWLPMYHDMGLVGTFLAALCNQCSVDYIPTEEFARRPMTWLQLMSRNRGTITYSPTFGYDLCARRASEEQIASLDLSPWRVAGIGADMIRADVLDNFAQTFAATGYRPEAFMASYGLAECTLAVSFAPVLTGIAAEIVPEACLSGKVPPSLPDGRTLSRGAGRTYRAVVDCGVPLPEYEIEIRDENGKVLGQREVGRLFLRGASVMREYFNDPEATAEVLQDGWLNTGDMAYLSGRSIFIVGRAKDLIIVNGRNHWPQDIEWAVEHIDGVRSGDACAISLPGAKDEEIATVLVQCRVSEAALRAKMIADIKRAVQQAVGIACDVILVGPRALPRTSSGKLSRSKSRLQLLSGAMPLVDTQGSAAALPLTAVAKAS